VPVPTQRADLAARRRAAVFVAAAGLLAAVIAMTLAYVRPAIEAWLTARANLLLAHPWWIAAAFGLLMLPVIAAAIHLRRVGARIVGAQRFPPPGMAVIRDTDVATGATAVRRGRLLQVVAAILVTAAVLMPVVTGWTLAQLARGR
jgi:hypothetical protein